MNKGTLIHKIAETLALIDIERVENLCPGYQHPFKRGVEQCFRDGNTSPKCGKGSVKPDLTSLKFGIMYDYKMTQLLQPDKTVTSGKTCELRAQMLPISETGLPWVCKDSVINGEDQIEIRTVPMAKK